MTVTKKLTLMVLSALVGIALMTGVAAYQMRRVYDAGHFLASNSVPSLVALAELSKPLASRRVQIWLHMTAANAIQRADLDAKIAQNRQQVEEELKFYETNLISDDKDRALYATVRHNMTAVDELYEHILALSRQGKAVEARSLILANQPTITKLWDSIDEVRNYNRDLGKGTAATGK